MGIRRLGRPLLIGALAVCFAIAAAQASPRTDPRQLVTDLGTGVIKLTNDKGQPAATRKQAFARLANQTFDVSGIARFALGPVWRIATPAQRRQFEVAFDKYMIDVYWSRFERAKGASFTVTGERNAAPGETLVSTRLIAPNSGRSIDAKWRVDCSHGPCKITDVVIDNISEVLTYRSEFSDILAGRGGNVAALIERLQQKHLNLARAP